MDNSDFNILDFLEFTMTTDQPVEGNTSRAPQDPLRGELPQDPLVKEVQGQQGDTDHLLSMNFACSQIAKSDLPPTNIRSKPLTAIYNCKECNFSTMNRNRMQKHQDKHLSVKPNTPYNVYKTDNLKNILYKCPHCSFKTNRYCGVKIHMRIHLNAKPFKCIDCEFRAKDIKELIEHDKEGHVKNKLYICNVCQYNTMYKDKLLAHKKSHLKT